LWRWIWREKPPCLHEWRPSVMTLHAWGYECRPARICKLCGDWQSLSPEQFYALYGEQFYAVAGEALLHRESNDDRKT
jgi:hypothetical protein